MLEYWIWLAQLPAVILRTKHNLLEYFGTAEAIFSADREELLQVEGMTGETADAMDDHDLTQAEQTLEECQRKGASILTYADARYPQRLKNIYDSPVLLYYKGALPDFDSLPVIGVVGTRKASAYGMSVARRFGYEISMCGGLVVSGLAAGNDAAAMSGALLAGKSTVGVLGCGIDVIFPKSNQYLFGDTERYGCILSEYGPGVRPDKWNFPRRNRIISGLSCGVVVVEAPIRSGSLITAREANEQGRDVFVVPGNVDMPSFSGSLQLLNDGAKAVACGWDVMQEYKYHFPDIVHQDATKLPSNEMPKAEEAVAQKPSSPRKKKSSETVSSEKSIDKVPSPAYIDLSKILQGKSPDEQLIINAVGMKERLVDDVIAETGLSAARMMCLLTLLEIRKVIVRLPGKRIALRK